MKRIKRMMFTSILVCALLALTGCGKGESWEERWAYIHDTETEILCLGSDGKAEYKGEKYSYTKDDQYIELTDGSGKPLKMRYVMDGEQMLLYEKTVYTYSGNEQGDGVIGLWKQENGWSFEFTNKGTFCEDTYFTGHYSVDEENAVIKLMYNDRFVDTYLYYRIEGNQLYIEYPWAMVRM